MQAAAEYPDRLPLAPSSSIRVYRYATSRELRCALNCGGVAGLVTGILAQTPTLVTVRQILFSPENFIDQTWIILIVSLAVLGLFGLVIGLLALRLRWTAPSRKAKVLVGAATGLFFALAFHSALIGGVSALIANRDQFAFFYHTVEETHRIPIVFLALYRTIIEHQVTIWMMIGFYGLIGAVLGGAVLSRGHDQEQVNRARDASGSFAAIILPFAFQVMAIVNTVIYALIGEALSKNLTQADGSLIVLVTAVGPLCVQLLIQILVLFWLWKQQPSDLQRGMLRFAQVIYGIGSTVIQVLLYWLINRNFMFSPFGLMIIGSSVILGAAFFILAQIKLRTRPQEQVPQYRLELTSTQVAAAGRTVVIILWLLIDAFVFRIAYNMFNVSVNIQQVLLPDRPITLNNIVFGALFGGSLLSLLGLIIALAGSYIPFLIIGWLATWWERRWSRKMMTANIEKSRGNQDEPYPIEHG